jgi:hypothetical protein
MTEVIILPRQFWRAPNPPALSVAFTDNPAQQNNRKKPDRPIGGSHDSPPDRSPRFKRREFIELRPMQVRIVHNIHMKR